MKPSERRGIIWLAVCLLVFAVGAWKGCADSRNDYRDDSFGPRNGNVAVTDTAQVKVKEKEEKKKKSKKRGGKGKQKKEKSEKEPEPSTKKERPIYGVLQDTIPD